MNSTENVGLKGWAHLWKDPEWRKKRSEQVKEQHKDPEFKAKLNAALDKRRGDQSALMKSLRADPEFQRKQIEGARRAHDIRERNCRVCGASYIGGRLSMLCERCSEGRYFLKQFIPLLAIRDGGDCQLCLEPIDFLANSGRGPSVDHIVPYSMGGATELDNLRLAHRSCNTKRGNRQS